MLTIIYPVPEQVSLTKLARVKVRFELGQFCNVAAQVDLTEYARRPIMVCEWETWPRLNSWAPSDWRGP